MTVSVPGSLKPSAIERASPVPVVCLALGDFYGLGDLYAVRMFEMLQRHMATPWRLVCYTDRRRNLPAEVEQRDCSGWTELERPGMRVTTRKLGLFNPQYVEFEDFLYLDLTLVIRQSMTGLTGFAAQSKEDLVIVQDWHYDGYNSCVMRIRPRPLEFIYEAFVEGRTFQQRIPGDQDFTRAVIRDGQQEHRVALFPRGMVASFKQAWKIGRRDPQRSRQMVHDATIVKFHGSPRMHEAFDHRHQLKLWFRDVRRGRLTPSLPLGELRREWLGTK